MATSFTDNLRLQKPSTSDRNWDVPLNSNADLLEGITALAGLFVSPSELPSASLGVNIAPGRYRRADGAFASFPGAASLSLYASSVTYIWLAESGTVQTGAAFPDALHIPLAQATTNASVVESITDLRVQCSSGGNGLIAFGSKGCSVQGPFTVRLDGSGSSLIQADPVAGKLGFFGATPASQATVSASLIDHSNGVISGTISDAGASFSQATLNANFAALTSKVNELIAALKRFGLMSS